MRSPLPPGAAIAALLLSTSTCSRRAGTPAATRQDAPPAVARGESGQESGQESGHRGPIPIPSRCPRDMRHVAGSLCSSLRHKCVRGRGPRAGLSCPGGCEVHPDHCAEWLPGSGRCGGPSRSMDFCMDEMEWPNRRGELPAVFVSFFDAARLCASVGKRLCTSAEFTLACEGPGGLPVGYGWRIDGAACNVGRPWRDWSRVRLRTPEGLAAVDQREPVGSRPGCASPYGVLDLTGNVDEWTARDPMDPPSTRHPGRLKGGYYAQGAHPYCRARTDAHGPDFAFYQIGTRCCLDSPAGAKSAPGAVGWGHEQERERRRKTGER